MLPRSSHGLKGAIRVADLRGDIAAFIRRPWFWCRDKQLPRILVTGCDAIEVAEEMAAPFTDYLPTALVRESGHGSVPALVAALAGPQGQLGKPVGGSFLPAPRFPLAQFVLWAREQKATPVPEVKNWPPDPQSHEGAHLPHRARLRPRRRPLEGQPHGQSRALGVLTTKIEYAVTRSMADRSSQPHPSPRRTPTRTERRIIKVRVTHRWGPVRIAYLPGLYPSTVYRVPARYQPAQLTHLDRPPPCPSAVTSTIDRATWCM